ncbi:hypothetical protein KR222_006552 [Zaprionus bogoriensis]|nr:hypothetical protein KR222_006552 [Zaprionus bogoriensis]
MYARLKILLQVIILLTIGESLSAVKMKFTPQTVEVFSSCPNVPQNVLNIHGMIDLSFIKFEMNDDFSIYVSGNATSVWNVDKNDKIQARFDLYKFDRSSWVATPIGMSVLDAGSVLYDKNQYWYKMWTQYVINAEEIKNDSLMHGTVFQHTPFYIDMKFDMPGNSFRGQHKIVGNLKAYSPLKVLRDTSICFEVIGEFEDL